MSPTLLNGCVLPKRADVATSVEFSEVSRRNCRKTEIQVSGPRAAICQKHRQVLCLQIDDQGPFDILLGEEPTRQLLRQVKAMQQEKHLRSKCLSIGYQRERVTKTFFVDRNHLGSFFRQLENLIPQIKDSVTAPLELVPTRGLMQGKAQSSHNRQGLVL